MLPQGLKHLSGQGHHPLLSRLGCCPAVLGWWEPITLEGLGNQDLSLTPPDAIPRQSPDFSISESSAQPQQKQRVIPALLLLKVTQHCLDFTRAQHITLHWPSFPPQLMGEQSPVTTRALPVVGHQSSNGAVTQSLIPQPLQKSFCITAVTDGLSIPKQQPVGVNGCSLPQALCPHPQCLKQSHLLACHQRLICHQAPIKAALLVVTPYLGTDGLCLCHCHWVFPTTQTIDKTITTINPYPHLQCSVITSQWWCFSHESKSAH